MEENSISPPFMLPTLFLIPSSPFLPMYEKIVGMLKEFGK